MPDAGTVLVLQHVTCEPPGFYEDVLVERGLRIQRVQLGDGDPVPRLDDQVGVVVMGGPMGATDDHDHPWLADERALIADAVARKVPYWGVCLGAQLLAAALGAKVYRSPEPEVGMGNVRLTLAGLADPVFGTTPVTYDVFQWHSDTFDLPPGAVHLASSGVCPHQVFALDSAYGVQFHLEVSAELAQEWAAIPAYRSALEDVHGPGATEAVLGDLAAQVDTSRELATTVFRAWLDHWVH